MPLQTNKNKPALRKSLALHTFLFGNRSDQIRSNRFNRTAGRSKFELNMLSRAFRPALLRRFAHANTKPSTATPKSLTYTPTPNMGSAAPAAYGTRDEDAYFSVTRTAIVWTGSLSLFAVLVGTFGYSLWWHWEREQARRRGQDLDTWFDEFNKTDPVANRLRQWGLERGPAQALPYEVARPMEGK